MCRIIIILGGATMPYDPLRHHRRSIRLKGYDYSQAGAYFVTICTQNRACILNVPVVNAMIGHWWEELPNKFTTISLDAFVIMPNHIHGIICLHEADEPAQAIPLGQVIQWFKTMTTNAYIRGVKESNWEPFMGRVWQRNYYEHIIRNERELEAIRLYIAANPENWTADENHPGRLVG
jgi:REP element-mobilizing transposase RayT